MTQDVVIDVAPRRRLLAAEQTHQFDLTLVNYLLINGLIRVQLLGCKNITYARDVRVQFLECKYNAIQLYIYSERLKEERTAVFCAYFVSL